MKGRTVRKNSFRQCNPGNISHFPARGHGNSLSSIESGASGFRRARAEAVRPRLAGWTKTALKASRKPIKLPKLARAGTLPAPFQRRTDDPNPGSETRFNQTRFDKTWVCH